MHLLPPVCHFIVVRFTSRLPGNSKLPVTSSYPVLSPIVVESFPANNHELHSALPPFHPPFGRLEREWGSHVGRERAAKWMATGVKRKATRLNNARQAILDDAFELPHPSGPWGQFDTGYQLATNG